MVQECMDIYYKYNGAAGKDDASDNDIGLVNGGCELVFLTGIIASYLFKMTNSHFTKAIIRGIYLDDDLVVFKGHQTPMQICQWLEHFQHKINQIMGGTYLQFMTKVWNPPVQSNTGA
eukprot:14776043-Ditylum_brightwellii.AAC.1